MPKNRGLRKEAGLWLWLYKKFLQDMQNRGEDGELSDETRRRVEEITGDSIQRVVDNLESPRVVDNTADVL